MNLDEYASLDATALSGLVRAGELHPDELHTLAVRASERVNPSINAVIETLEDPRRAGGRVASQGPFAGVPFLVKDVGATLAGLRSECGSRLCAGLTPERNSEVLLRFLAAGMQAVGRSTASEFGMLTTTETALNGATCTPWHPGRSAAGSSGGAGAAVAAGIVPIGHGGDAGGSIRLPASYCGVVGLKPSRGRVSRQPKGAGALDWVVDFALTRSVRDTATLLDAVAGPALGDPYVIPWSNEPFAAALDREIGPLRVALCSQPWSGVPALSELDVAVQAAGAALEQAGAMVESASPQFSSEQFVEAQVGVFAPLFVGDAELLAQRTGRELGPETLEPHCLAVLAEGRRRGLTGLVEAFERAHAVALDIAPFFEHYEVLVTPTIPTLPEPLGAFKGEEDDGLAEIASLWSRHGTYTDVFNLLGVPAISLPLAVSAGGLPIGVQLVGRFGAEDTLLSCAAQLERALPWAQRRPPVHVCACDQELRAARHTREQAETAGAVAASPVVRG